MAEVSAPTESEKDFSTVQELVQSGGDSNEEVPHKYIWQDTNYGPIDVAATSSGEIPAIDLSRLISSAAAMDAELKKLRSALTTWGCFQLINHGIENSFLDELRRVSRKFFHLPKMEKQKYVRPVDGIEGYGSDMVLFENQSIDWNDRLYLLVSPKDQQKLEYWPENPEIFRKMLDEFTGSLRQIQELILKAIAISLSLPENCILNQFGERPTMYARFNYYPPCSRPDVVLGLKPHADGSGITILLQDEEVEGLQMLKDDQWFRVPIMPHALLVNVGDQVEIMSNGLIKSPMHRAVTNSAKERNTIAMFCSPDPELEIGPVNELVGDTGSILYKKVRNYPETYFKYYQQGKRPIEALRI
ncbi:oxidoreductase family protein [Dorcoceras hygrometricum]|nr:oxidoreductase family protein [Dorcoceras hygrometricum]